MRVLEFTWSAIDQTLDAFCEADYAEGGLGIIMIVICFVFDIVMIAAKLLFDLFYWVVCWPLGRVAALAVRR